MRKVADYRDTLHQMTNAAIEAFGFEPLSKRQFSRLFTARLNNLPRRSRTNISVKEMDKFVEELHEDVFWAAM